MSFDKETACLILVLSVTGCSGKVENDAPSSGLTGAGGTAAPTTGGASGGATGGSLGLGGTMATTSNVSQDDSGWTFPCRLPIQTTLLTDCSLPFSITSTMDVNRINVNYYDATGETLLGYSSGCTSARASWMYDDLVAPTRIIICPNFCPEAQANPAATFQILFGCG